MGFNPIKEDKQGKSFDIQWSTAILDQALKGLERGKKLVANPFYDNKTYLLKGDLVFTRTKEEVEEWKKCKNDILYFAGKYCKLMTPEGIKNVTLRDYQVEYLKHLQDHRLSIFLACRQCGKCFLLIDNVMIHIDNETLLKKSIKNKNFDKLKKEWDVIYRINKDTYLIPMFEIYNLQDVSFKWKIEYRIYKLIYKLICLKEKHQKKTVGRI